MTRSGIKGFKKSSSGLQADVHKGARRDGTDRPGKSKSIVPGSGDSKSPTGRKVTARRNAAYGGSAGSSMQKAIGGPYSGKGGNRASKTARVDRLSK